MADVLDRPEQIDALRLSVLIQCLQTHIKFGGRMRLTRTATPTTMREIASEYTGKRYARSMKGLESALTDLTALRESLIN